MARDVRLSRTVRSRANRTTEAARLIVKKRLEIEDWRVLEERESWVNSLVSRKSPP